MSEQRAASVDESTPETVGIERVRDTVIREFEQVHKLARSGIRLRGLPTGFARLDAMTGGLHPGTVTVLGGRPGMGKTAFATNLMVNACHARLGTERNSALYFSPGTRKQTVVRRMLAAEARVDLSRLSTGQVHRDDWKSLAQAAGTLSDLPLFVDDRPRLTIEDIRERTKSMDEQHGLALVVIDYLQFVEPACRGDTSEREMAGISRELKLLARDAEHIAFLAISTLNRSVEGRATRAHRRPVLSDLRESGSLEDDADVVLLLYRDEYYNPETLDVGLAEVHVAKQGLGPTGRVMLRFRAQYARFDDIPEAQLDRDDPPASETKTSEPNGRPRKRRPAKAPPDPERAAVTATTATDPDSEQ